MARDNNHWEKAQAPTSSYKYQHSEAWALLNCDVWKASLVLAQKKFPGQAKDIQLAWYEGKAFK